MLLSKFTGKTMVFKNENGCYRTTSSTKNREGAYVNKGINIAFKKGVDIPNKTVIDVKNGWLTFDEYVSKQDNQKKTSDFKIFVSEYEVEGGQTTEPKATPASNSDDVMFGDASDLPF